MASVGTVTVECPECDAQLAIPVSAQIDGKADNGVVQVSVLPDMTEVELHALVCSR